MTGSLVAVIIGAALIIGGSVLLVLEIRSKRNSLHGNSIKSEMTNSGVILLGIGLGLVSIGMLMSG
jgi:hypothetical protein